MSFGSPCQDWSVAGKRLGLKGHRSSLFHEAIRIIRLCEPRFAVFENVPGLFSAAGGWDFAVVLDEMAESGALDIAWRVLDAQWFGVPQRRRRIFLVADFGGERAGEILSIEEGVQRHPAPSREAGKAVTALSANGVGTCGADDNQAQGNHLIAHALTGEGHDASEDGTGRDTPLIPDVSFALNANERWDGESETFISIQDGREIDKRQNGLGVSEPGDPAYTVDTLGAGAVAFAENQRGEVRTSECRPPLTSGGGKPGQGYPAVAFTERTRSDGRNFEYLEDQAYALTNPGSGGRTHSRQLVQGMAVRRLTPLDANACRVCRMAGPTSLAPRTQHVIGHLVTPGPIPLGVWVMKGITGLPR